MQISCCICKKVVGEILMGSKLKKGTVYLCDQCNTKRIADELVDRTSSNPVEAALRKQFPGADMKFTGGS